MNKRALYNTVLLFVSAFIVGTGISIALTTIPANYIVIGLGFGTVALMGKLVYDMQK